MSRRRSPVRISSSLPAHSPQPAMPLRDTLYTLTKYTASALGITVISAGALLYAFQTRLIYPSNIPSGSRTIVATPDEFDMPHYENVELTTPDGVRIRAFLILQRETDPASVKASDRPTVLLLHANAGNVVRACRVTRLCFSSRASQLIRRFRARRDIVYPSPKYFTRT